MMMWLFISTGPHLVVRLPSMEEMFLKGIAQISTTGNSTEMLDTVYLAFTLYRLILMLTY